LLNFRGLGFSWVKASLQTQKLFIELDRTAMLLNQLSAVKSAREKFIFRHIISLDTYFILFSWRLWFYSSYVLEDKYFA